MAGFNLGPLRAAISRLQADLDSGIQQVLQETKEEVRRYVASSARFSKKTGSPRLARAVRARLSRQRLTLWVQGVVPRALELGARPHLISAKNSRFLRFRVGSRYVFRRRVWHPGNPAYQFLGQAYENAGSSFFSRRIREMANAAAARF